jgi:glutaminase
MSRDVSPPLAGLVSTARLVEDGVPFAAIPALARVDPTLTAAAVCNLDGTLESAGDARATFTLQSVSKPFAWAVALERFGIEAVLERVGVEPSGDRFDAVIRLEPGTGRPFNPMVNAGALAIAGMFVEADGALAPTRLLEAFARWAGRPLDIDLEVALSEREHGSFRNRAIAWLLTHHGVVRAEVDAVLELYLQQCAILATVEDLAVMAATLANGGVNPRSHERVLDPALVPRVLAVMTTCGAYDDSGRFAFDIGLPIKTGVSGAMLAVAPHRCGLATFAPPLDDGGHSIRGRRLLLELAQELRLGAFAEPAQPRPRDLATSDLDTALTAARAADAAGLGQVAAALAHLLPDHGAAIAVAGVDGSITEAGDLGRPVSLQACANPFTWLLVAAELGLEAVAERTGVEPSGNPYHAILLDTHTRRPANPLGNAGAIAICDLVPGASAADRLVWLARGFAGLAGHDEPLRVDAAVLAAEHAGAARNRAIANLLRAVGAIDNEEAALELYLQQCSLRVELADLARMAATLAAGGVTSDGRRLAPAALVTKLQALLITCGLHDESGHAAWEVGLPMKSGISGLIFAVVPGVCGIAAWSPRVNVHGTSPGALATIQTLARRQRWNVFS